jgi:hypothetical protein
MSLSALESTVNTAFDARDGISTSTKGEVREAVDHALELLDKGETRVAERGADGKWKVNQWLKKAVLLSFRLNDMSAIPGGPGKASWWDKVPSKFEGWGENRFRDAGFRAVPGAIVRPRHRRDFYRRGSGIFGRGSRRPARQAAAERPARSLDRLRRDHEARRRAHPLQDQHQRTAAGLSHNRF